MGGCSWGGSLQLPSLQRLPPIPGTLQGEDGADMGASNPPGGDTERAGSLQPPPLADTGEGLWGAHSSGMGGGGVMGLGSEHPWPCLGTRAPPVRSPGMSVLLKKQSQKFCKAKTGVRCWGPAEGGCRMRPSAGTGQGEGSVGARVGGWGGQWPDSAHAGPRATLRGGAALLIFNCWCPAVVVAGGGGGRWWALVVVGSG